jgi:zinc-finger protein CreA/MIG
MQSSSSDYPHPNIQPSTTLSALHENLYYQFPGPAAATAATPAAAAAMSSNGISLMTPTLQSPLQNQQSGHEEQRPDMPRPYQCHICQKAFHRLEHQTRHIRTHTGEKPHACMFAGCTKRFSRSDELTRHSRIHNNPNSRRGRGQVLASARQQDAGRSSLLDSHRMPPPRTISRSAPSSNLASPNVSPPHHYLSYAHGASNLSPYSIRRSGDQSPNHLPRLDLMASSAHHVPDGHYSQFPSVNTGARLASLSRYSLSAQPMSRSHSHEADDPYSHRHTKRSRPNSPYSTAPPSPTFSNDSFSPTPDHTPIATPAHSPRIRPQGWQDLHLPTLRQLSLHPTQPALVPLEPHADTSAGSMGLYPRSSLSNSGTRISDILHRSDVSQRKLPIPRLSVSDSMHIIGSGSSASSTTGGDFGERM